MTESATKPAVASVDDAPIEPHSATPARIVGIITSMLRLGCTSFGGPIAHLGYLREEFVVRRRWLDDGHYGDLVALCQFLPGPASSQVVFGLGMHRAGFIGAMLASLCFTLPSAALMIAFAYGVARFGDLHSVGWLHGLKLAAVIVVAQAVWGMGRRLCTDRLRILLCLSAAALLLTLPGAFVQVGVIAVGALVGWLAYRKNAPVAPIIPSHTERRPWHHVAAGMALLIYALLLAILPMLVPVLGSTFLTEFDSFYRAGSFVFGGGHVVLPLLRAEVVPHGWLSDDHFLAGYGAAQAVPGPLFTFSAYLGAAMHPGRGAWINGAWCLFAIFLPAWLLIGGAWPFWHSLRAKQWARAALVGANAAVVGVLLAALYAPMFVETIRQRGDLAAALIGFALIEHWNVPSWALVLGFAAVGQWLL